MKKRHKASARKKYIGAASGVAAWHQRGAHKAIINNKRK